MADDNLMLPEGSPSAATHSPGVRKVNSKPLLIAIGLAAMFILAIAAVAYKRGEIQKKALADNEANAKTKVSSTDLANGVLSGERAEKLLLPPELPKTPSAVNNPNGLGQAQNVPPPAQQAPPVDQDLERIKQAKMQAFEEAVKAGTKVSIIGGENKPYGGFSASPGGGSDTQAKLNEVRRRLAMERGGTQDPGAAYQSKLEAVKATLGGGTGGGSGGSLPLAPANAKAKGGGQEVDFISAEGVKGDRWFLGNAVEAPGTPYMLRAGAVIPGVMISGINSELPGQLLAQVSQDVYDTATGRIKLLPQGTKLFGSYSSDVIYGQEAVLVAWQRLTFPDGKVLDIGAMPGADEAGYAGFRDQVNHHYFRTIGSALLMSAIVGGVALSQDNNTQGSSGSGFQQNSNNTLSQILGQQLGQVTGQMISKNLNIAPTIEIRPGYSFNVIATKDITLPSEYRQFDY